MRILITGGAGFIGSHLAEALVRRDEEVTILDNFSTGRESNLEEIRHEVRIRRGDLRDRDAVRDALRGIEAVLHHAAWVSVPGSVEDPVGSSDVNILGTALLLQECQRAEVKRLVFASSSAVYGDLDSPRLQESLCPAPISPYGTQKLAGEHLCRGASYHAGLDTVCFRYFNVYGPRQRDDSAYAAVIAAFRSRTRAGQAPIIYGNGQQTRDFIHVQDIVEANRRALASTERWQGQVMNLARGEAVTIENLAREISRLEGYRGEPDFAPPRPGDLQNSVADVTRLRNILRWSPPTSLEAGLAMVDEPVS